MIVLDTHALLWWALEPERLSNKAREVTAEMERRGGFVSAISIWEIAIKVKRGKLELPLSAEQLTQRLERSAVVQIVPVDAGTWLRSVALPWEHNDPADRVIVATALNQGVPLLTKDACIQSSGEVTCIW